MRGETRGTAFATEQAKLLKRIASEIVFCYDSDSAGRKASVRAVSIARAEGLKVRIAGVPEGKDPDEYVRHYGKEAFLEVIAQAREGIDFQIEETILQSDVSNLAGKVEAVSNILPFLLEWKFDLRHGRINCRKSPPVLYIKTAAERRTL